MFDVLQSLFQRAIRQLPKRTQADDDESRSIVQHLVPLYWWGRLNLEAGPLHDFLAHSSVQQRAGLLKYVGFSLLHDGGVVPNSVVERSQRLWDARLQAVRDGSTTVEELPPFGWWFASGKFPNDWALSNLKEVLRHQSELEVEQSVAERLGALAATEPLEALECLAALCDAATDDWRAMGLHDGVAAAVRAARAAPDPRSAELANALVSRLVARGNIEYLDIA
jgi:hypothetical protein